VAVLIRPVLKEIRASSQKEIVFLDQLVEKLAIAVLVSVQIFHKE
jgi:hypothetical protein